VIDSLGFPTRIIYPTKRHYEGRIITFKAKGLQPVTVTEEHPILVRENSFPRWIKMGDISEGDYVLTPNIPWLYEDEHVDGKSKRKDSKINKIPFSKEFFELLGWYCADGYPSGEDGLSFSLGIKEGDILRVEELIRNLGLNTWRVKDGNCIIVNTGSTILRRIVLSLCGKGAYYKHVPECVLYGNPEYINNFVYGYCCGDGYEEKNKPSLKFATISPNLAHQIALIGIRLGILSSVMLNQRKEVEIEIQGRICHQKKYIYRVAFYGVELNHNTHQIDKKPYSERSKRFFDEYGLWSPVQYISEQKYCGEVYNLHTVRGTYMVENIAVHNCGTPTVVAPSGCWNETTVHGYNGFFATDDDSFIYYIKRIDDIKPENCRKHAEHFSYQRMGDEYLKLYTEVMEGRGW